MRYVVVLKNLKTNERLTLSEPLSEQAAQGRRVSWRRVLGGKNWTIDRRLGLDTLDHLGLTVERV